MPSTKPTPDEIVPAYIVEGIDRQDMDTLKAIEEYARERREHLVALEARDLDDQELADDDEEVVEVAEQDNGTVVVKKVPCGKDCGGCPHGPYKYVVRRSGDSLEWEYKGPVETSS